MKREDKKNQLREKILRQTQELLKSKSIDEITANEICGAASISKRTLYQYYASKNEIYLEIIYCAFKEMNDFIQKNRVTINRNEELLSIAKAYINYHVTRPFEGKLLTQFNAEHYLDYPEMLKRISGIANLFEPLSLFKNLELDDEKYDAHMAIFMWSQLLGTVQLISNKREWLEDYYKCSIDEIVNKQVEMIKKTMEGAFDV